MPKIHLLPSPAGTDFSFPALPTTDLASCEVVLAPSWRSLVGCAELAGKRVACRLEVAPFTAMTDPAFRTLPERVDLWLVPDANSARQAALLGWRHAIVPPTVDGTRFPFEGEPAARAAFRRSVGISEAAFVLGCFSADPGGSALFVELARALKSEGLPVSALVADEGLRALLISVGVPAVAAAAAAEAYHALDLYVAAGRWHCPPRFLLEAAASGAPVVATPSGLAEELLPAERRFRSLGEGVALAAKLAREGRSAARELARKCREHYSAVAAAQALGLALQSLSGIPLRAEPTPRVSSVRNTTSIRSRLRRLVGGALPPPAERPVSFLREFVKPPYGGGNQFMLALKDAFERGGVPVAVNEVGEGVRAYYFDSLWFQPKLLRRLEREPHGPVVHRIDGPIYLYRGKDRHIDDEIFAVNRRLATATVIQSEFTLTKIFESGYSPARVVVIRNAANPGIFHAKPPGPPKGGRIRVIASSWSDNPNKGGPVYKWLDENLDYSRYEFTFVGRCSEKLTRARVLEPVPSERLAELLREHDVYVTASQNDPCSNALVEALSCGLPSIALRSGGHPELVGFGGLCFDRAEEIPACLDEIALRYESYQRLLSPPRMDDVSARYLALAGEG